jgi:hypothetical protein
MPMACAQGAPPTGLKTSSCLEWLTSSPVGCTEAVAGSDDHDFELGRLTVWHEVVSLMQQQALAFGISPADLSLDDVSPERDLT